MVSSFTTPRKPVLPTAAAVLALGTLPGFALMRLVADAAESTAASGNVILVTVDTLLTEGVPVLRVVPGSPAAQAGLQPGDVLVSVDGKAVARTADLLAAVEAKSARDRISLHVRGAAGTRVVELALAQTPQEIPLNDPALLYHKVMMDLRQQVDGYPGSETAAFARFNLGISAMHFGDFAAAHEQPRDQIRPPRLRHTRK